MDINAQVQEFLEFFPEFESAPQKRCALFLEQAINAIPDGRFGSQTKYGRHLYTAHLLTVLGDGIQSDAQTGATAKAQVASKAVGSANVSYDTGSSSEADAGYWNGTGYGRLYWGLLRQYRAMPICVVGRAQWP